MGTYNNGLVLNNDEQVPNNDGLVPNDFWQMPNNDERVPNNDGQVPNDNTNALSDELVPNDHKTSLIMIDKCIIETKQWFGGIATAWPNLFCYLRLFSDTRSL